MAIRNVISFVILNLVAGCGATNQAAFAWPPIDNPLQISELRCPSGATLHKNKTKTGNTYQCLKSSGEAHGLKVDITDGKFSIEDFEDGKIKAPSIWLDRDGRAFTMMNGTSFISIR